MRRSLLFMPANSPAMLQNADIFEADGVIFDLEDAVVATDKDAARDLLNHYLSTFGQHNMEYIVRINAIDSNFFTYDIKEIISDAIDTILLPKASKATIKKLSSLLDDLENTKKMQKKIAIIALIESPKAFFELKDIACHKRVNGLLLGAEDLAMHLEIERSKKGLEILYARSQIIFAAKSYGIDAIDTPFVHIRDDEGLSDDAQMAKALGMTAKACIHPNQIDRINQIFSPSQEEIEKAQKIMLACHLEENKNKGAFVLDGQMIDKPIIEKAEKLLKKAKSWKLI